MKTHRFPRDLSTKLPTEDSFGGRNEVPRHPRLLKRSGVYSYRAKVPAELRSVIGKSEIWKRLGTIAPAEALRLARIEAVATDRLFQSVRAAMDAAKASIEPAEAATPRKILEVAQALLYRLEVEAAPVPFDEDQREQALSCAIDEAVGMHGAPAYEHRKAAIQIAKDAGLALAENSAQMWEMIGAVKRAFDEHSGRQVSRLSLQAVAKSSDPAFADIFANKPPAKAGLTLAAAIKAFGADPARAGLSAKTVASYRFRLAAWADLLGGNTPIKSITRAKLKDARDILITIPPNASKRWPGLSLREVAKIAAKENLPPMHAKSARHAIDCIAALLRWLHREGEIDSNPGIGIGAPPPPAERSRRALTIGELKRLFSSGVYADLSGSRDWRFWAPLISLFMGLRIAEIAGLDADDVVEQDEVLALHVRPNTTRTLKNVQSARVVPIHPALIELGFAAFATSAERGGLLFQLPAGAQHPADAMAKAMAYSFKRTFPDDRRVVFHGLRHTWADACRNAYIPRDITERLGGWKASGSEFVRYGAGYRPSILAAEIAKVRYDNLSLDHLKHGDKGNPA